MNGSVSALNAPNFSCGIPVREERSGIHWDDLNAPNAHNVLIKTEYLNVKGVPQNDKGTSPTSLAVEEKAFGFWKA